MISNRREEVEILIEREKDFLWRRALEITGKNEDADDLFQDTVVNVFRGFISFNPDTNFRAWARRIMINTHLNKVRRHLSGSAPLLGVYRNSENVFLKDLPYVSDTDDPEKVFFYKHINDDLISLFYSMPEEYRTVFALFHFNGYTYDEISRALNIPVGTVKSRIYRAKQLMTSKVKDMRSA